MNGLADLDLYLSITMIRDDCAREGQVLDHTSHRNGSDHDRYLDSNRVDCYRDGVLRVCAISNASDRIRCHVTTLTLYLSINQPINTNHSIDRSGSVYQ